jgi:hypothetical protein
MTRQPPEIQRAGLGQQAVFQMFRIVAASGTTTTTTTTTTSSTTGAPSTTTTTSTTTTAPPCKMRVWYGNAVDARFDDAPLADPTASELRALEVHARSTANVPLYSPRAIDLQSNDVVLAARYNGQWYVLAVYGNCPASTQTTSTTTSTTSTSTTRPPTRPARVPAP